MAEIREWNLGVALFFAGAVTMIVGLLGIGAAGEADWVSAVVGSVGAMIWAAGVYLLSRSKRTGKPRHAAS